MRSIERGRAGTIHPTLFCCISERIETRPKNLPGECERDTHTVQFLKDFNLKKRGACVLWNAHIATICAVDSLAF